MSQLKISDQLSSNYENYYGQGDCEWRRLGAMDKADNIIALCNGLPHRSLLEIGAGEGSIMKRLSDLSFGDELYALEISKSGVDVIKNKKIARMVECKTFDGYAIPYENDKFDIAIMSHVVEHVEHPRQFLYEAARVAKYVFVEVPLEDTIRLPRDFVFDKVGHINYYSPTTIRRLLQSCGLRVLGQINTNPSSSVYRYQNGNNGLINYFIKNVSLKVFPNMAPRLFCYHGALVCEKAAC